MIAQYEMVVLVHEIPEFKLAAGDVGAIVEIYDNGAAYEVEFCTRDGHTVALLSLPADAVRLPQPKEMLCVRDTLRDPTRDQLSAIGAEFWLNPDDDAEWNEPIGKR